MFQLYIVGSIAADDQVRQLQEELRRRNLFFGNPDGEFSFALTTALSRYQRRKGFPVTGRLDPETSASLGMVHAEPRVAPTPFVVARTGDVRGLNGEQLPASTPLFAPVPEAAGQTASEPSDVSVKFISVPDQPPADLRRSTAARKHRGRSSARSRAARRETNPFVLAYQSVDHALKGIFRDAPAKKKREARKRG